MIFTIQYGNEVECVLDSVFVCGVRLDEVEKKFRDLVRGRPNLRNYGATLRESINKWLMYFRKTQLCCDS